MVHDPAKSGGSMANSLGLGDDDFAILFDVLAGLARARPRVKPA